MIMIILNSTFLCEFLNVCHHFSKSWVSPLDIKNANYHHMIKKYILEISIHFHTICMYIINCLPLQLTKILFGIQKAK